MSESYERRLQTLISRFRSARLVLKSELLDWLSELIMLLQPPGFERLPGRQYIEELLAASRTEGPDEEVNNQQAVDLLNQALIAYTNARIEADIQVEAAMADIDRELSMPLIYQFEPLAWMKDLMRAYGPPRLRSDSAVNPADLISRLGDLRLELARPLPPPMQHLVRWLKEQTGSVSVPALSDRLLECLADLQSDQAAPPMDLAA